MCRRDKSSIASSLVFAGLNIALQGVFQALDSGMESLVISLLRQLVLVLPIAWLFARSIKNGSGSEWLVWLTFIIAEGASAVVGSHIHAPYKQTKDIRAG